MREAHDIFIEVEIALIISWRSSHWDLHEVSLSAYTKMREHLDGSEGIGDEGTDKEWRDLL